MNSCCDKTTIDLKCYEEPFVDGEDFEKQFGTPSEGCDSLLDCCFIGSNKCVFCSQLYCHFHIGGDYCSDCIVNFWKWK